MRKAARTLVEYGKESWLGRCPAKRLLMGLAVLCLLLLSVTPAQALSFYTGNVSIQSLSATIDVTDRAAITVDYVLVNSEDSEEAIEMAFSPPDAVARIDESGLANPVIFNPGDARHLFLSYFLNLQDAESQGIMFSPMLFFNGMANSNRVGSYSVELILPESIERITWASLPYTGTAERDNRTAIIWEKSDFYPAPLAISWTTLDVNIAAAKSTVPQTVSAPGEVVQVEVTVQNKGSEKIEDIALVDSFFPGAFEAVDPLSEFSLIEKESSDPRLYWKKEGASLEPGETIVHCYSIRVKALGLETRLDPLVVLVNDTPVSVSNDVILHSALGERYEAEAEGKFPTFYVVVGAVILVALISLLLLFRSRKKARSHSG
jgi:hypothetical protein